MPLDDRLTSDRKENMVLIKLEAFGNFCQLLMFWKERGILPQV